MRARGLKQTLLHWQDVLFKSRPMRARGLKLPSRLHGGQRAGVAPHAGAWVETDRGRSAWRHRLSRPMRARGLKLFAHHVEELGHASRPMRARGLKRPSPSRSTIRHKSRPMRARGLKHRVGHLRITVLQCRAPCGRVG